MKRDIPDPRLTNTQPQAPEIRKVKDYVFDPNNHIPPQKMKRLFNWIKGVITSENKAGQVIHGILDLLPIPNQPIAKLFSYLFKGKTLEARKQLDKLLTIRNGIAVVVSILVVTGVVSMEQIQMIVELLSQL